MENRIEIVIEAPEPDICSPVSLVMPPKPPPPRTASGRNLARSNSRQSNGDAEERKKKFRRAPKSTNETQGPSRVTEEEAEGSDGELGDVEQELQRMILQSLGECSRQRLRALQMALRSQGSTESRISAKDLYVVLQENQVKLSGRAFQMLVELYEDSLGIDYERLLRSLVTAQAKSGRDSVIAQNKKNDVASSNKRSHMTPEEKDADLITRLEGQFLKAEDPFSLQSLREEFQAMDKDKAGKLSKENIMQLCTSQQLPIYGALLNALLNRCDDENSGHSSWPEVMSFLEQTYQNLVTTGRLSTPFTSQLESEELSEPLRKQLVKNAFKKAVGEGAGNQSPRSRPMSNARAATGFLNSMRGLMHKGKKPDGAVPLVENATEGKPSTPRGKTDADKAPPSPKVISGQPSFPLKPLNSPVPTKSPTGAIPAKGVATIEVRGQSVLVPLPDNLKNQKVNTDPPRERLKLEWVYGYRGNDCRSNIYNLQNGEIVYHIGSVVVLYNPLLHSQRHYREHSAEILCIAVHPNGISVASGQSETAPGANDAHIRLWRSDTLQTLHILGMGTIKRTAICISFSRPKVTLQTKDTEETTSSKPAYSEDRICCVDGSLDHQLHVWDVANGAFIAATQLGLEMVCDVDFNPLDPSLMVVSGKEHLGWWMLDTENRIIQLHRKPDYQNYLRAKFVTALLHTERGDLITGDSNGTVYVWGKSGNIITNLVKHAHQGPIFGLLLTRGTLITGGRDSMIYGWMWNKNMDQLAKLQVPLQEGGVRMLQLHGTDLLVIGTTTNSILTAKLAGQALRNPLSGVSISAQPLTQGHYDEVVSVCIPVSPLHPDQFLTAGRDGILSLYNTTTRQPVWKHSLKGFRIYCADINPTGTCVVVGSRDVIAAYVMERVEEVLEDGVESKEDPKWHMQVTELFALPVQTDGCKLSTIKMAPDGQSVCMGDSGGRLYRVGIGQDDEGNNCWKLLAKSQGHKAGITALDWSIDKLSNTFVIRSSCSHFQFNLWMSDTLKRLEMYPDARNLRWASAHCKINYATAGIWHSKQALSAEVMAVDISPSQSLLLMADSSGYISMFRYPCNKKGISPHVTRVHESIVKDACFSADGARVLTVHAADRAAMQWILKHE